MFQPNHIASSLRNGAVMFHLGSRGRGIAAVTMAIGTLLSGCATMPADKPASEYGALYDGKAKVLHEARGDATSAREAINWGDAAYRMGNVDQALYEYVKALGIDGKNLETLYKVGTLHAGRGNRELAELAFRMALKLDERHVPSLEGLGLVQLERHLHKEAEESLTKAVAAEPNRWRAHNGLGLIADLRKDYPAAGSHYQNALKLQPGSAMLLNNLGYSKYLAGDWDGAQQLFDQAVQADPKYERAWINLGLVHARRGEDEASLRSFRRVMDDPSAYNNIGFVFMMEGKYDQAGRYYEQAISSSPAYHAQAQENLKRLRVLWNQ